MKTVLITGSNGLIGSAAVSFFAPKADLILGLDNNMRKHFFGNDGDTKWRELKLKNKFKNFIPINNDIRNYRGLKQIFRKYNSDIDLIIHTAAQPSHDWALKDPILDFEVNANGTLNLLQLTKIFSLVVIFSCASHILVTKFEASKTLYRNLKVEFFLMPFFLLALFFLTSKNYDFSITYQTG